MDTELIIKEDKYCYSKEYQIKYYEMDFKRILKPSALLNFLQDMATINADSLGFGYSFTYPKNYGWFLIKYHMEFEDYPEQLDDIIIKTEPRGVSKILAFRDFEIYSTNKKLLGRVTSNWMMVDLETKNVLPLSKILDSIMPPYQKRDSDMQFSKIFAPQTCTNKSLFEIRYDDIDVNQHVNNANYIVWALETLPFEFKSKHKIKILDIVYKKEIAFGYNVISQLELDENSETSIHVLKNESTGEDLCIIQIQWN